MDERFRRAGAILGDAAMKRLSESRVAVLGLGGVGSWCAEALCRSGVGTLYLLDQDTVSLSNVNRQPFALTPRPDMPKAEAAAERSRENVAAARTAAEEMRAPVEEKNTTAMIAAARADAEKMLSLPDGGQTAVNEKTRQAVEGVEAEVPLSPTAVSGKRYLVRPGDTLSKLALEA